MEIYFAPTKQSVKLTLDELAQKFAAANLSCTIEPESSEMHRLVFEGFDSTVLASVKDGAFVFGTLDLSPEDEPSFIETVETVMQAIGFSADEDADYI